jgi:hypothetical protein
MEFINKYKKIVLITFVGALAGVGYWYFVGCNGATCAITSNWYSSALYGGLFGLLLSDFKFRNQKKKTDG